MQVTYQSNHVLDFVLDSAPDMLSARRVGGTRYSARGVQVLFSQTSQSYPQVELRVNAGAPFAPVTLFFDTALQAQLENGQLRQVLGAPGAGIPGMVTGNANGSGFFTHVLTLSSNEAYENVFVQAFVDDATQGLPLSNVVNILVAN